MAVCPSCSAEVRPATKFCTQCGNKIEITPAPSPKNDPTVEPVAPEPLPAAEIPTDDTQPATGFSSNKVFLIGAVLLVAIVVFSVIVGTNRAEQEALTVQLGEKVALTCASTLSPQDPAIVSASVIEHRDYMQRVRIRILDAKGEPLGSEATCDYSVTDGFFYIENISWDTQLDGVATQITYDGKTNNFSIEKEDVAPRDPEPATSGSATGMSCEQAFREAASVPLSMDNNAEIEATTEACSNVDEWWAMLKRYPDVFGVTYLLESEKGLFVGSACLVGGNSPVCVDAARLGLTF